MSSLSHAIKCLSYTVQSPHLSTTLYSECAWGDCCSRKLVPVCISLVHIYRIVQEFGTRQRRNMQVLCTYAASTQHNRQGRPCASQDFSTADAFLDAISKSWHEEWQRVYSTDRADTVPFKDSGVDYHVVYTPSIKFWSVFSQGGHGATLCCLAAVRGAGSFSKLLESSRMISASHDDVLL